MNDPRSPGSRALRRGRDSVPGAHYLITTVCHGREPRFMHAAPASRVAQALGSASLWRDAEPLCWVLMPDHMHVLLALGQAESLSRLIQRVKCVTAGIANEGEGRGGPVWMTGFHDRGVRCEAALLPLARYLIANPVRAGLVQRVTEYPYWDCVWVSGTRDDPVG